MNAIDWVNQKYHQATQLPEFKSGDTIRVHVKIKEGEKERVQVYEGVCIAIHNNGPSTTFTVRKISYGVGVERIFPMNSPTIDKIEIVSVGKVRRAKLYYLRELSGKKARIKAVAHHTLREKAAKAAAKKEALGSKAEEAPATEKAE